ncbi:hypothetical protein B0I35DRAFT_420657 [Stachybotrys elegans]|uniref:Protein kinase domain-containing protein n=1 Tax=Stachybotrys elegans TaxID=80388 RepID=A0A8K0WYM8_9HYPO|nr:hypothetical protein B0I35DRAFT_420657 [Stachybotrys elegans]
MEDPGSELLDLPTLVRDSRLHARFWSDGGQQYTANFPLNDVESSDEQVWLHVKQLGRGSALEQRVSAKELRVVKCICANAASDEAYSRKLEAYAKFSQEKYSELFVSIMGWFCSPGQIYLAMEYCELGDLQHYLSTCASGLPQDQAREIMSQLLRGLVTLHTEQFFHGSLKPSNILIKSHQPWKIKLINFGVKQDAYTPTGGSRFHAPETFLGRENDPFAADMWCLGETLFEILCGRPTFAAFTELTEYIYGDSGSVESGLEASGVSYVAISLISSLLAGEPSRRPTAQDAANHTWNTLEPAASEKQAASLSMSLLSEWSWSQDASSTLSLIVEDARASFPQHHSSIRSRPSLDESLEELNYDSTTKLAKVAVRKPAIVESSRPRRNQASWISQIPALETEDQKRPESTDISLKTEPTRLKGRLWHTARRSLDKSTLKNRVHELWVERETERLYRYIIQWRKENLDKKEEANLLNSMSDLVKILKEDRASFAVQFLRETITIREMVASRDRVMVHATDHLATIFMEQSKWDIAAEILEHSLEAKKSMLHKGNNLAWGATQLMHALCNATILIKPESSCRLLVELGESLLQTISQASSKEHGFYTSKEGYHEAEKIFRAALALSKAAFGTKHKTLPDIMERIALCLSVQSQINEAEKVYLLTLRLRDEMLGRSHPRTLRTMEALATMLKSHNKLAAADAFFRYLIELRRGTLGPEHPQTLASMHDRGETLFLQKRFTEAEAVHRETLAARREALGYEHEDTVKTLHHLGADLLSQMRYAEAEEIFKEAGELRVRILGEEHPETLQSLNCTIVARNKKGGKGKYFKS